jgi:hypothetical protein
MLHSNPCSAGSQNHITNEATVMWFENNCNKGISFTAISAMNITHKTNFKLTSH